MVATLLDRVEAGEEVTITRHGRPVAIVVRPDALRGRRAGPAWAAAGQVLDRLAVAGREPLTDVDGLSPDRADELIGRLRADRDSD